MPILDNKYEVPACAQELSGTHFSAKGHCDLSAQGHCDLDFRPIELKINMDLGKTNLHTKYGATGPKRSLVIESKPFFSSQGDGKLTL